MITPRFEISQDSDYIYIKIHISNIRFNSQGLELLVDKNLFIFYLSPYYLRLRFDNELQNLDGETEDNGETDASTRVTAEYKSKEERIDVRIPKLVSGTEFKDLDTPLKLLARKGDILATNQQQKKELGSISKGPLIQEVESTASKSNIEPYAHENIEDIAKDGEDFEWEIKQTLNLGDDSDTNGVANIAFNRIGFDNQYSSDIIEISCSHGNDINEVALSSLKTKSANERVLERIANENNKFDPDYYASEYMTFVHGTEEDLEINGIKTILKCIPVIPKLYLLWFKENGGNNANKNGHKFFVEFSKEEQNQMSDNLPNKTYFVDDVKPLYLTILSLLFAYMYEQLENECQHNTESAWTIGKLTPQLSNLDQQLILKDISAPTINVVREAIIIGLRKAVAYPLHRNYELGMKCWDYVYYTLLGGCKLVAKVLLDIHELFRFHDVYYVYNKILLDDLCSWFIKYGNENVINNLANEVKIQIRNDRIKKGDIQFDCVTGINETNGEVEYEKMNLEEIESIAEKQYSELLEQQEFEEQD
ncbi:related to Protein SHQ1 [Saccharomycodes ludwigii]|uniref:Related to Protein SHQ1 n=1 Tax=Saccharomycodes ludwigii TaxID=36035 RepID=A0A376B305_9ASCO|nr:hypothetical protein SCDLUD_002770 [Saccharomycodes ludwigii]KAH3901280.1 hypothetical protein SCDLUD_002770 [Saccharomycodes ludwigii]SSD59065.1 related to Protein SHQ1 [Saccharomycodes ludwigii]